MAAATDKTPPVVTAAMVARRYGAPSVFVQLSNYGDVPMIGPIYTDYSAVMDDHARTILKKHSSLPAEHFVVTGLTRWDTIVQMLAEVQHNRAAIVSRIRQQLALHADERLVVFATQPIGLEYMRRLLHVIIEALTHSPEIRLVIKLHPKEADLVPFYEDVLDGCSLLPHRPLIVADVHLHGLLAASDLVLTASSNVGLEAAVLDRHVLVVNLSDAPDPVNFVKNGIAWGAYSKAEVEQHIARLLNDPTAGEQLRASRQAYFRTNPQLIDGNATGRVVELLRRLANPGASQQQPVPREKAERHAAPIER
jgi:UDP-N-acetylglucosamine 2-epimerase